MKVYISVDIEGTANAVGWGLKQRRGGLDYERNRLEMTKEAVAPPGEHTLPGLMKS